jgi:hypothetical protein
VINFKPPFRNGKLSTDEELSDVELPDDDDPYRVDCALAAGETGDIDRLRQGRFTMLGLPEKMTDTTLAVTSWLLLRAGDLGDSSPTDSYSDSKS